MPEWDIHTIPVFDKDEYRVHRQRNSNRYPRFSSTDVQVTRPFTVHMGGQLKLCRRCRIQPLQSQQSRDVQTIVNSSHYGDFYNDAWRTFRGKLIFQW